MVEWHVVTGVVPPMSGDAWDETFHRYQQTPEYKKINRGMSLEDFKTIYYREYTHRILGRATGLAFVIPLLAFLARGAIPRSRLPAFLGIGFLFALQGLVGWFMVQSGLVDQPHVSHYRLTLHLLCALVLLAACLWYGFEYGLALPAAGQGRVSPLFKGLSVALLLAVCVQIAAGALVAGLKAGYISDTFPKMFGQWVPEGLWRMQPWIANLLENPAMVHFQHRWFGFVVLGMALALAVQLRREPALPPLRLGVLGILHLLLLQVVLGVAAVALHVPAALASLHQAVALAIFILALFVCHQVFRVR
jgi:cytochrome c oxidase assembly protein subunit 15